MGSASLFVFNTDLQFTYVDQSGQRQTGYSLNELQQMSPWTLKPEFTEARFRRLISPLQHGDACELEFDTLHQSKTGGIIPVHIRLHKPANSDCYAAVVIDRKALLEEALLRHALDLRAY